MITNVIWTNSPWKTKQARIAFEVLCVCVGSLLIAMTAQIRIPVPGTLVPITGQTLGVLLVASMLGSRAGMAAVGLYLFEGACGLPVFAGGTFGVHLLGGATGGYLIGFLPAAFLTGLLVERGWGRTLLGALMAMSSGTVVILICGWFWLAFGLGTGPEVALAHGVVPFLFGAAVKIAVGASVISGAGKLSTRLFE